MTEYTIPKPAQPTLVISGSAALYPVRRIYCIGRNYADHAIEMGHDPDREPPFFFQKNPDNADQSGHFPYPSLSSSVHHEVELVVALKSGGKNIAEDQAMDCVWGYAAGLDMTRRDRQAEMKKLGRPWEVGKAFEHSAPLGLLSPAEKAGSMQQGHICLKVNGDIRQSGDLNQMIWKIPQMISILSAHYTLAAGDLIMTGTPAGVGPVEPGDVLEAEIEGLNKLSVTVAQAL